MAALLIALPVQAQWKWRDAAGRLHASDLPPPSQVPDKDILQRPGPPKSLLPRAVAAPASAASGPGTSAPPTPGVGNAPGAQAGGTLDQEVERRRKAEEQERAAKARADEDRRNAQKADNCERARAAAASLESGQRITRTNARGEREVLDDPQRSAELRRAREVMSSECR